MTPVELLDEARCRGIALEPDGDWLIYRGPKGAMTPELKDALVESKGEVLAYLKANCLTCVCPPNWWHCRLELDCPSCRGAVCATCGGCLSNRYRKRDKGGV